MQHIKHTERIKLKYEEHIKYAKQSAKILDVLLLRTHTHADNLCFIFSKQNIINGKNVYLYGPVYNGYVGVTVRASHNLR